MTRRIAALTIALMIATVAVRAQTTAPTGQATIQQWVDDLASELAAKREKAQVELVAAGQDAVPALNKLLETTKNPEARDQAKLALKQIGENHRMGATLVTLHVKDMHPREALAALEKQSGMSFRMLTESDWGGRGEVKPVTVDAERRPYWEVFRSICQQAGLSLREFGMLRLIPEKPSNFDGPNCVSGPFFIEATSAYYNYDRSVGYARNDRSTSERLSVTLGVYPEPKLRGVQYYQRITITHAVDEKGNDMAAKVTYPDQWSNGREVIEGYGVQLKPSKESGGTLKKLAGSFRVRLAAGTEKWELPNVLAAKGKEKQIGDVLLSVKEARRDKQTITLNLSAQSPSARRDVSSRSSRSAVLIVALSPSGKEITRHTLTLNGGSGGVSMSFTAQEDGPVKLVWEVPTETKEIEVPFEFTDLPLP